MKVETNLKAGNALNDLANLSCKSLKYSAGFINQADRQAAKLAGAVNNGAQTTWNTIVGWLNRV
jgi:hypothetical protein